MSDSLVDHLEQWSDQDSPNAIHMTEPQVSSRNLFYFVIPISSLWLTKILCQSQNGPLTNFVRGSITYVWPPVRMDQIQTHDSLRCNWIQCRQTGGPPYGDPLNVLFQAKDVDSPASDSESNPSLGQSIYDKYPPKSSDQEESEAEVNEHLRPDPMGNVTDISYFYGIL